MERSLLFRRDPRIPGCGQLSYLIDMRRTGEPYNKERMPPRLYVVYIGKRVGCDWYSVSVMTANRADTA